VAFGKPRLAGAFVSVASACAALLVPAGAGAASSVYGKRTTTGLPRGAEPVDLTPAEFTVKIDNPYWPMKPGSRWVYREKDGEGGVQRVVVTVTEETSPMACPPVPKRAAAAGPAPAQPRTC